MMLAVGTDLVEIDRFTKSFNQNSGFEARVFAPQESEQLRTRPQPMQSFAAAFAAKEAFAKAIGTGLSGFKLTEVMLLHEKNGKPYLELTGNAKIAANGCSFTVSISHTAAFATATVIAYKGQG